MYRELILENKLGLPNYINFVEAIGEEYTNLADKFFKALWNRYLKDKGSISLPYWSDRFNNPIVFNQILMALSGSWIITHSIPERNWAEANINEDKLLKYCTPNELEQVRATNKFAQYRLEKELSTKATATRLNGTTQNTGLVREGFMEAGNTRFSYDTAKMEEYKEVIQKNLTKSMDKIAKLCPNLRHDQASYDTISISMLDYYLNSDQVYTRGDNYNDSRGRAISSSLSKIGNPISCKDFRSLLVIE